MQRRRPQGRTKPAMARWILSGMRAQIDPRAEWQQMFNEVYRQQRDYFFEPSMNGVNWAAVRDKYAPLLPHIADRYDLTYVLGEMIGELVEFAHIHGRRRLSGAAAGERGRPGSGF